jgi:hypothetical protein
VAKVLREQFCFSRLENLVRKVFKYLSKSLKKLAALQMISSYAGKVTVKCLNVASTRWLSMSGALERLWDNYPAILRKV